MGMRPVKGVSAPYNKKIVNLAEAYNDDEVEPKWETNSAQGTRTSFMVNY